MSVDAGKKYTNGWKVCSKIVVFPHRILFFDQFKFVKMRELKRLCEGSLFCVSGLGRMSVILVFEFSDKKEKS